MDITTHPFETLDEPDRRRILAVLAGDGPDLGLLLVSLGGIALEEGKTRLANNLFNSALYQEDARGRPGGQVAVDALTRLVETSLKLGNSHEASNWSSRLLAAAPDDQTRKAARRMKRRADKALHGNEPVARPSGPPSVGNQPLSTFEASESGLRFSDIGGLSRAKDALNRVAILPLSDPESAARFGITVGGGVLMYGPPGCGKTMLAQAAAGEMGVPLIRVKAADLLHPLYGMAERNLNHAFVTARKASPCVLFIEEIDGIAQPRDTDFLHRSLVNTLLTELEGENDGVVVIAATNQIDRVDKAVTRPGRFDKLVPVEVPDAPARAAIWTSNLANRPCDERVDTTVLVSLSEGLNGAEIAEICQTAAESVWMQCLADGIDRRIGMVDLLVSLRRGYADGDIKHRIDELISQGWADEIARSRPEEDGQDGDDGAREQ